MHTRLNNIHCFETNVYLSTAETSILSDTCGVGLAGQVSTGCRDKIECSDGTTVGSKVLETSRRRAESNIVELLL